MQHFNLVEMWRSMGFLAKGVAILLIVLAIWMVAVGLERLIRYMRGRDQSLRFVIALRGLLAKNDTAGALAAAKEYKWSPLAKNMEVALDELAECTKLQKAGCHDFDAIEAVNRALDRSKERETTNLRRGLGGLATIASAAPFIGLFGTVVGIINAFTSLSGGGGLDVVGPGIAEALVTTAVGLAVAVPALVLFNTYTQQVERFVVDMNDVSSEFIAYLLRREAEEAKK